MKIHLQHIALLENCHSTSKQKRQEFIIQNVVAHAYDGCSSAPLTQYKNNDIYCDLVEEYDYFDEKSDERIYIDMRTSKGCLMN